MNDPNTPFDSNTPEYQEEWLSAYLDEELLPAQRMVVEQRLATDPSAMQLLQEIKHIRRLVAGLPGWTGKNLVVDVEAAPANNSQVNLQVAATNNLEEPSSQSLEPESEEIDAILASDNDSVEQELPAGPENSSAMANVTPLPFSKSTRKDQVPLTQVTRRPKASDWRAWLMPLALAASLLGMLGVGYLLWQGDGFSSLVAAKTSSDSVETQQESGEMSAIEESLSAPGNDPGEGMVRAEPDGFDQDPKSNPQRPQPYDLPAPPSVAFPLAPPAGGSEKEAASEMQLQLPDARGARLAELPIPPAGLLDERSLAMADNLANASQSGSEALVDPVRKDAAETLPPIPSESEPPPANLGLGKSAASSPPNGSDSELRFAMSSAWSEAELKAAIADTQIFLGRAVVERFRQNATGLADLSPTQALPPTSIAIARFDGNDSTERIFSELMSEHPSLREPATLSDTELVRSPLSTTEKQRVGSLDGQDLIALFVSRQEAREILQSKQVGQSSSVKFSSALWISAADLKTTELPSDKVILLLKPKTE